MDSVINLRSWSYYTDKYYGAESRLREVLIRHSRAVADLALDINRRKHLGLQDADVEAAAMLHDIGIFMCDAPSIECRGSQPYIRHGILGAELLRSEGAPEWLARVAERHTGAGLSKEDILRQGLPLPAKDFLPETLLEQLVCYADKFFSKSGDMAMKTPGKVRESMARFGEESLARYDRLHKMFS